MHLFPAGVVALMWWLAATGTNDWVPIGGTFGLFAIFSVAAYRLFRGALKGQSGLIAQQQARIEQLNERAYLTDIEHRKALAEVVRDCDRKQTLADQRQLESEKRLHSAERTTARLILEVQRHGIEVPPEVWGTTKEGRDE
jgi:hypothetical protein